MNLSTASTANLPARVPGGSVRHIPSLDGLRAASIALVLLGHESFSVPFHGPIADYFWVVLNDGHLGVMVFFVISGYLITYLLRREQEKAGKIDLRAFYWRRILRIFPAFYTFLAVLTVLVFLKIVPLSATDLTLSATYTWNYRFFTLPWNLTAHSPPLTPQSWYAGHLWSLSVEEQFYLIWPPLLVWMGLKRGLGIALGIMMVEPFLRVATHFLVPSLRGSCMVMLPWTMDPLMFGAVAALCQGQPGFERAWARLSNGWLALAVAAFLLGISPILASRFSGGYDVPFAPTVQSATILFLLLWLVRRPDTTVGRVFNFPVVAATGVLSYSLYLWQQLFLVPWSDHRWLTQIFPVNLFCCFAVAFGSYHLIEKPFLRLKERFGPVPLGSRHRE